MTVRDAHKSGAHGGPQPTPKRTDPVIGTTINGKFKVERAIARGGMGRIYYGLQAPLDRPVALKIVKTDTSNEDEAQFLKRFLLEASILAKLQHPNIVTLFDYGKIEDAPSEMYFIAMEFLDGETLTERLRTHGALTALETVTLLRQIARGLREAHARGVIHRDLKPSNIVLVPDADGEIVKIVDFGIGKVERQGEDLTRDGVLVGTPKYMAPEQFDGHSSPASDVYALGTIIYQCLAGVVPFEGSSVTEFMVAKLTRTFPPLREVNPIVDASVTLEKLVYAMLAKKAEERPSLDEVFTQLAQCEEEVFGVGARLALTGAGSRPSLGVRSNSRPASVGALKVPYTVVAPIPMVTSSAGVPILTGFTPRPMSTSSFPSSPPQRSKRALLLALLAACGVAVAVGLYVKLRSHPEEPRAQVTSAPPPSVPPVSPTFKLEITSDPPGAAVLDGDQDVGKTPITLDVDRAKTPKTYTLKLAGYVENKVTQGPSDGASHQSVTLAPEPSKNVKSPAHGGGRPGGKPTSPDDIRLRR